MSDFWKMVINLFLPELLHAPRILISCGQCFLSSSTLPCTARNIIMCADEKEALTIGQKLESVHRMRSW